MTERLYYTDCYVAEFQAQIEAVQENGRKVYLDRTAFYPASGGQPHDFGSINGVEVLEVIDDGDRIAHLIAGPLQPGTATCRVDWARRLDHMQQHTGQHLLSAVWEHLYGYQTVSFHMGAEVSTIELASKELGDEKIVAAEERANAIVREARPVSISFEEAEEAAGLRKVSARTGTIRVVTIQDLDRSACGGTHLRSTAEIGAILIRKTERLRGNTRIEFVCGVRAIRRARQDYAVALELSRAIAVAIDDLPEAVIQLQKRLADADKDRQKLGSELATFEGVALHGQTAAGADGIRRLFQTVPTLDEATRLRLQAFTREGKAIALVAGVDPAGVLIACSSDSGLNAGAILKAALTSAGARGGGSALLAQGSLPNPDVLQSLKNALGFEN